MTFATALQTYLRDLAHARHRTVAETSRYGYLQTLLDAAGEELARPRVRALVHPLGQGAGLPDLALVGENQGAGDLPAAGVVEVKGAAADVERTARSEQVRKYLARYGQVLVTNYFDFLLVTADRHGEPQLEERYRLAENEAEFWELAQQPRQLTARHAAALREYLHRVLRRQAPLRTPQDVAQTLASYAREARARIEQGGADLQRLQRVREQLEAALGLHFDDSRGEAFFRSSLIQTLFYGVFSAWVLWHEERPTRSDRFDLWRDVRELSIPAVQQLFEQFSTPSRLDPLDIEEVLEWTASALNRVERGAFFRVFDAGEAVQYFYEPFLEAFDPDLRRQLGVWYTPPAVVDYMVARVDEALRSELGIADGLADERVVVLDPCCGTGAYLVSILRRLHAHYRDRHGDGLAGQYVKRAVQERIFGFEILPAPFVVAHLQIGTLLSSMNAPLLDADERPRGQREAERAGVYLTNALTGWEEEPPTLSDNILRGESEAAHAVKRERDILVVLGNPPYSGFAGTAMDEERDLTTAYRSTRRAPRPQGQGLNDLYVRFFRMAERRIVEMSGRGVVCFISNYSWLDGLSHTGMRERYLEAFDSITIDSLNGDKYRTGKTTPQGDPDPSIFSTGFNREGIQVGTAIATLVRRGEPRAAQADFADSAAPNAERTGATGQPSQALVDAPPIHYRDLWGTTKLAQLEDAARRGMEFHAPTGRAPAYETLAPQLELGYPFMPRRVSADYFAWPTLPELFPVSFPGVKTSRDAALVEIDRATLEQRIDHYFDPSIGSAEMAKISPAIMKSNRRFDAVAGREEILKSGQRGKIVRYAYRPLDVRWLYWHPTTKFLDEKREEYFEQVKDGNITLISQQKPRREWSEPQVIHDIGCLDLMDRGATCFPLYLYDDDATTLFGGQRENLSALAGRYLKSVGAGAETLFFHSLAVLHAPRYRLENAGALRQDWPRVPLPDAANGGRETLLASAALGRQVAALLDAERQVDGVTAGNVRADLRPVAEFASSGGATDFTLSASWGYALASGAVMPGGGRTAEYVNEDGHSVLDIFLNDDNRWRGVPLAVWDYTLGGYPVLKKWLSYRDVRVLARPLRLDEVSEFTAIARRIAALLSLAGELDGNYASLVGS